MMKRSNCSRSDRRVYCGTIELRAEGDVIRAALSSETPVKRSFGIEILDHSPGAVDLSRASKGLPLIVQHDHGGALPVGRVRNIVLEPDRVLRGDLHFSQRAEAQSIRQDVMDEIITAVSLGYTVDRKHVKKTGDTYRFGKFTPLEVSLVSVPADENVGINRNEDPPMEPTPKKPAEETRAPVSDELAIYQGYARFMSREGVAELQTRVLGEHLSEADAMKQLLDHLGNAGEPEPGSAAGAVVPGEDSKEKFHRAAENAILVRSGVANEEELEEGKANPFSSYSLVELARAWADVNGIDMAGKTASGIVTRAIDPGTANLDTTDFTAILENVMNKALFRGFDEAPVTWNQWCSVGNVADFKAYTRPGLSQFTSLETVAENGLIQDGIMIDKKEGGALVTKARKLSLTREAIINDDLSAFSENATKMGEAASRTVDEDVYALLESGTLGVGPTMLEDATPLFDAVTHFNHITAIAGGTPPTEAAITVAKVAMGKQVDQNAILLGIRPIFSLGPLELEETFQKLATAEFSPDGAANPFEPNSIRGTFQPITSPRLTDSFAWYMLGGRGQTIEVNFLNGQASPSMERDTGWSTFAMHWKVWIDVDVLPLDWRAMYKDMGQ